jgi:hypothetical protein
MIKESRSKNLPDVSGQYIFSGKKTNIIYADPGKANLAGNNARTLFAQVPGINVWEMDGAGLQLNIGTRGTDMHRSIETNIARMAITPTRMLLVTRRTTTICRSRLLARCNTFVAHRRCSLAASLVVW